MDYRIELVLLDAAETRRIRERLGPSPDLSLRVIHSLIPLFAVVERAEGHLWFAGFGSTRIRSEVTAGCHRLAVQAPLLDLSAGGSVPRTMLRAAAISLGLPEEWACVPHRSPVDGAGIAGFL